MFLRIVGTACLTMAGLSSVVAAQTTWYVDDDNCPGPGSGTEADPYCSIQTAIDNAVDADEILVAPGIYLETIDFLGKAIALRSTDGPEMTIIDAQQTGSVVTCDSGEGPETALEGFTLTGGTGTLVEQYPGHFYLMGGGMFNLNSSPTVADCTFQENDGDGRGGGMANWDNSNPTVTDCIFDENAGWAGGGGMYNHQSNPTVIDSAFGGNTASGMLNDRSNPAVAGCTFIENSGGGMSNLSCTPTVIDCSFIGNSGRGMNNHYGSPTVTGCQFSGNGDGGMRNDDYSSPTLTGCAFVDNHATRGGGMWNNDNSSPTLINCLFVANTADDLAGGISSGVWSSPTLINCTLSGNTGGAVGGVSGDATVVNCILWDNTPGQIILPSVVSYSNVQGGYPGPGNIDADPLFADPDNGDLRLSPDSPCLDAGHNWGVAPDLADLDADGDTNELTPFDLDGNPRFVHAPVDPHPGCGIPAIVDMGAYEFPDGTAADIKLGDIDGDGMVGYIDFLLLLDAWGVCAAGCCLADFDLDGEVGVLDFLKLLSSWG
ncbi:MAG: right-handed parallel beta-helix repeat-containing protein [Planctomycetota bacterium]